jgi:hypothetical protein
MAEVRIDGVLYVPVSEAHVDAKRIEDAVCKSWGGDGWQRLYPHIKDTLRVIVSDSFEEDEGMTVAEFIAMVLADG